MPPPCSTWALAKEQEIKVLICGSSESGKTKLLKDMRLYTGYVFTREELDCFARINCKSTVQSFRIILEAMGPLKIRLQHKTNEHHARNILMQAAQAQERYSVEAAIEITELWADAGIQEAFKRRHEYQLMDNVSYFANHIQRLTVAGYTPSQEDIIRSRVATTGVTETSIHLDDTVFRVFDVGGMWRHRWHLRESVDIIVFTVDASAYCRNLWEDESMNRMQEQLILWDKIANHSNDRGSFIKRNFVLVFTKVDSLPETIKMSPISQYFPDFQEPVDSPNTAQLIDSYLAFLTEKFISIMESEAAREQTQVVFADLVHVEDKDPGGLVLEHLKSRSAAQL